MNEPLLPVLVVIPCRYVECAVASGGTPAKDGEKEREASRSYGNFSHRSSVHEILKPRGWSESA